MKLIVLNHGKRKLIETREEPNYKELYLQEDGTPFLDAPILHVEEVRELEREVEETSSTDVVKLYDCEECGMSYRTELGLKKHSKKH